MRKTILILALLILFCAQGVDAMGATLKVTPDSGSYEKQFEASIVVDGNGQSFNAIEATVSVSSNLSIKDLTYGDCKFSFVTTPTTQSPSFSGVLLGKSAKRCIVYSMTLVPIAQGDSSIVLSQASIRRFGDAVDILGMTGNASYVLTAGVATNSSPLAQTVETPRDGSYTVSLKMTDNEGFPQKNIQVKLVNVSTNVPHIIETDSEGIAHYSSLQPGIYIASVLGSENDTVINLSGPNHSMSFGIVVQTDLKHTFISPISVVISGGVIIICCLTFFIIKRKQKTKITI